MDAVKDTNGDYEPGQRCRTVLLLGQPRPLLPEIRSVLEVALQDKDERIKVQAAVALYHDDLLFNICKDILLGAVKNKEVEYEAGHPPYHQKLGQSWKWRFKMRIRELELLGH